MISEPVPQCGELPERKPRLTPWVFCFITRANEEQLAALLNDARTRVDAALHGLEIQGADVGKTADYPRGFFARWKWLP